MKKLTHNLAVKIAAIFLLIAAIAGFAFSAAGIYLSAEYNFYRSTAIEIKNNLFESITRGYASTVFYEYFPAYNLNQNNLNEYQEAFSSKNTNFLFVLKNSDGDIILSNYSNEEYQLNKTYTFNDYFVYRYEDFTIDCFVKKTLNANDRYLKAEYFINLIYNLRYAYIPIAIASLIFAIILFIFLICSAGRRKGIEGITPNGIDKIPFDIYLSVLFATLFTEYHLLRKVTYITETGAIILITALCVFDILLLLQACMTFATRYKLGGWWKNTLTYRVLRFIYIIASKVLSGIKYLFNNIPLVFKTVLLICGISLVEFIVIASYYSRETIAILWFFEKIVIIPVILFIVIGLRKLQAAGKRIATGDLGYHVDSKYLFWDFKSHGDNLNSISEGMTKAVEARMKSERLKTELITNVSHDIKTPLTSIINYVDLIKKEDVESDTIKEYIGVLDKQTARLIKLTEDLIEASKASTGNVEVNLSRTEAGVFLTQIMGEYEEKINSCSIELIMKKPENEVYIMADGRLLWRVFDNIMNNICKYAQPSTRAYLNLDIEENQAFITFRNISKFPLNISSDELLDRFIRGDSSRNTEGSGLGLSIAKSLTELQKGQLDLYVDGDLFKVVLRFNTVQ